MRTGAGRRIALVGNAPSLLDRAAEIDAADRVVRINNPFGYGGRTGTRIDDLVLVNCGGQMGEWLADPGFGHRPAIQAARRIVLPIHPAKDDLYVPPLTDAERFARDHRNHGEAAAARLRRRGKEVRFLPLSAFLEAMTICGFMPIARGGGAPSTGLIALLWLLRETFRSDMIDVYGFGFEGWPGHAWTRERASFEHHEAAGRLRLNPI